MTGQASLIAAVSVRDMLKPVIFWNFPTRSMLLQDLREIFATIEAIPQAPKKLFEGLASWARGEQDPTWRK
jgi:hypothetical protein